MNDAKDSTVHSAVEKIRALRRLTDETGFRTTRSQNAVLESLTPQQLAEVAVLLNGKETNRHDGPR